MHQIKFLENYELGAELSFLLLTKVKPGLIRLMDLSG